MVGAWVSIIIATDGSRGGVDAPEVLALIRAREARAGAAMSDLRPDLIVAHPPNDYHVDHRVVARVALDVASYRQPVLWADTMMGTGFAPTHYIDVTAEQVAKEAAIRCHESQDPEIFVERVRLSGRFRAAQCGDDAGFAEAFRYEPTYPYADIRDLLPPAPRLRHMQDKIQPPSEGR